MRKMSGKVFRLQCDKATTKWSGQIARPHSTPQCTVQRGLNTQSKVHRGLNTNLTLHRGFTIHKTRKDCKHFSTKVLIVFLWTVFIPYLQSILPTRTSRHNSARIETLMKIIFLIPNWPRPTIDHRPPTTDHCCKRGKNNSATSHSSLRPRMPHVWTMK